MPQRGDVAPVTAIHYYLRAMASLRHLVRTAGRALALLAALVLALVPALPAHAHLHRSDPPVASAVHDHHAAGASVDLAERSGDHDHRLPQQGGDCCFVSHVSVIPAVSAVPLPAATLRQQVRSGDRAPPPDALAEALPEPPRPSA